MNHLLIMYFWQMQRVKHVFVLSNILSTGFIALLALIVGFVPFKTYAAPGDLDRSFGIEGKVITDLESTIYGALAVAIQTDGKIVAAVSSNHGFAFALVRYNTDGTLDTSFGNEGKVITDFESGPATPFALAIQMDGKIVAAGSGQNAFPCLMGEQSAIARYNSDGTLDSSFDEDGKLITCFDEWFTTQAVAIQSDNKIILVGVSATIFINDFGIARLNPDGSLDNNFGSAGLVSTDFGGSDVAKGVALQADGKIVVVGHGGPLSDFAIARYNSDGSLDMSFGSSGTVLTDYGGDDRANSVTLQADEKIVAAGEGNYRFALSRYNSNGSLDSTFNEDGKVTTSFLGENTESATSLAIQENGRILVGGTVNHSNPSFGLVRFNTNGSLDMDFGIDGQVMTDFGNPSDVGVLCPITIDDCSEDVLRALALQSDGRIVAAGGAGACIPSCNVALARYIGDPTAISIPPIAQAGSDQINDVGNQVILDGSASFDPDNYPSPLTYIWSQISGPTITLAGANTANPTFTPTIYGTYIFSLVVNDGADNSASDSVTVSVNAVPIADAGPDQVVNLGASAVLDGTESSDPDHGPSPLTYSWTQTAGPVVTLTNSTTAQPSFTPSEAGIYAFRLIVNDGRINSPFDDVTVSVNKVPIANAGTDQTVNAGAFVTLDGTGSYDPDNHPSSLTYQWTQTSGPTVALTGATTAQPSFTPSTVGTYVFSLVVIDGQASSTADSVTVTVTPIPNKGPTAHAGPDQIVNAGTPVTLNGSASTDPDNGPSPLTYQWTQTSGPSATLTGATTAQPSFTPLTPGTYVFSLVVNDGAVSSLADTVTVTVNDADYLVIQSPNNGEVWNEKSKQTISWVSHHLNSGLRMQLYLSIDGGSSWQLIASPRNLGYKTWSIPKNRYVTQQALFKICVKQKPALCDVSDRVFTINDQPVAEAGGTQKVLVGSQVSLDGNLSYDADHGPLNLHYYWTQVSGPVPVTLDDPSSPKPRFTPPVKGSYKFRLIVNDGAADSKRDKVTVKVVNTL